MSCERCKLVNEVAVEQMLQVRELKMEIEKTTAELAEMREATVTEQMMHFAKNDDLFHFARNLSDMIRYGYCKKCGLIPTACYLEGCGRVPQ